MPMLHDLSFAINLWPHRPCTILVSMFACVYLSVGLCVCVYYFIITETTKPSILAKCVHNRTQTGGMLPKQNMNESDVDINQIASPKYLFIYTMYLYNGYVHDIFIQHIWMGVCRCACVCVWGCVSVCEYCYHTDGSVQTLNKNACERKSEIDPRYIFDWLRSKAVHNQYHLMCVVCVCVCRLYYIK